MHFWLYILVAVISLYTLVYLVYSAAVLAIDSRPRLRRDKRISILIAARNEGHQINDCLNAIAGLDYPPELIEVLIGDDRSDDDTAQKIQSFIRDKPSFRYVYIGEDLPGIRGKQNVLAQLARLSRGEVLLVTDADIRVSPQWAAALVAALDEKIPLASGPTIVEGKGLFAHLQSLDWLMGIGAAAAHAKLGIPITAVGNNMAISREVYFSTGGYEALEFSITEDYKLFQAVCEKRRQGYRQLLGPSAFNVSSPVTSIRGWLQQRRRWFRGGSEIPWYNAAFLIFNGMIVPLLLLSLFFIPLKCSLLFFGIKSALDFIFLCLVSGKLGRIRLMIWFPLYEIYYQVAALVTPLNMYLPSKVNWKGRKY